MPGYNAHRITNLLCFPPKVVTVVHPLAMMRAEAIKSIGEYSSRYPHAEDYDMFMDTSKNRRFPSPRKSDSRFSYSERGRLAWDSLASSI